MPDISFPNLGIEFFKVSKVAFSIFSIDIVWYAVFIAIGILLGLNLAEYYAKKTDQDPELYFEYFLYAFVAAIVGARLYYVAFKWDNYKGNLLRILNIREGGLAVYGGIITAMIVAVVFAKKKKINLGLFLDTFAPSIALGQVLGRWGNFINREAFGGYTNSLFALRYIKNQVDQTLVTKDMLGVSEKGIEFIQVHPTFLYESLWNLVLFIILIIIRKRKKFDGQIIGMYFFGYGIGRAWIEGLRTDQLKVFNFPVSQFLSIFIIVISGIYLAVNFYKAYNNKKEYK